MQIINNMKSTFFNTFLVGLAAGCMFISCQPSVLSVAVPLDEAVAVSPRQIEFDAVGGSAAVVINSTVDWTIECAASWVTSSVLMGTPNDKQIIVSAQVNADPSPRSTTIIVKSSECEGTIEIAVTQKAAQSDHPLAPLFGHYSITDALDYYDNKQSMGIIISEFTGDDTKVSLEFLFTGCYITGTVNLSERTITLPGEFELMSDISYRYEFCCIESFYDHEVSFATTTIISFDGNFSKIILPPFGIYVTDKQVDNNSGWYTLFSNKLSFLKTN